MSMQDLNRNKQNQTRFEELMRQVNREGKGELLKYIKEETDFFTAPASTNFHLACEGGLLQHSLNVYDCLMLKKQNPVWEPILRDVPQESLIIVSLLHDLCKANFYVKGTKNVKTYDPEKVAAAEKWQVKHDAQGDFIWETVPGYRIEDSLPLGHGEKSVIMIMDHMGLTEEEQISLRWHMGFSEEKSTYSSVGKAIELYPIVLCLHEADVEASKLFEDVSGNKYFAEMVTQLVRVQKREECASVHDTVVDDDEFPFH